MKFVFISNLVNYVSVVNSVHPQSEQGAFSGVCGRTAPVVRCCLYSVAFFYSEYQLYTVLFTSGLSKGYLGSLLLVLICLKGLSVWG